MRVTAKSIEKSTQDAIHCPGCNGLVYGGYDDSEHDPCPGCRACAAKDAEITTLTARLAEVERERDSFQRIGKHYESVLHKAAESLNPGGTGRTAALVVTQDLPKIISDLDATRALLLRVLTHVAAFNAYLDGAHAQGGVVADWVPQGVLEAWEPLELLLEEPAVVALMKEEDA